MSNTPLSPPPSSPPGPSRENIWKMFDTISSSYDRTNRIMTGGLDQVWRKKLKRYLPSSTAPLALLDCATGTGDQITALMSGHCSIQSIVGIDLAEEMLAIAKQKIAKKSYTEKVQLLTASALEIPFADQTFDCITISFGIRNLTDVMKGLKEFHRVLKPGGRLIILEGTLPQKKWLKTLHRLYLRHYLPLLGKLLSRHPSAYQYLNQTIHSFPQGEKFCSKMRACGFLNVREHLLLGGVATIYIGDRDGSLFHQH